MIIKKVIRDKRETKDGETIFINNKKVYFLGIPIYTKDERRE